MNLTSLMHGNLGGAGRRMSVSFILLGTFIIPIVVVFGLLLEGVDRKVNARMQRRIGPPVIQPFYDIVKLFGKSYIIPVTADPYLFVAAPVLAAVCAVTGAVIVFANAVLRMSVFADLIIVTYLLAMPSLMKMLGASSSGNPYAAIGFSRMMTMLIAFKLPLLVSIITVAVKSGITLSIGSIISAQINNGICFAFASPSTALAALAFFLCITAEAGVVPFDIPEAKTEIIHGTMIEYGGPYLALFRIAKSTTVFSMVLLASVLFFYPNSSLIDQATYRICLDSALVFLFAMVVMLLTVTLPRTIFSRLKIGQALGFFWAVPLVIGVVSSILCAIWM
ncbi:MAG: complex I subunit 1 family protein [Candidatus Bathyarchaeia archaeon]